MGLFRIRTTYFTCGVVTNDAGIITRAAPIVEWSIGKHHSELRSWAQRKGVLLEWLIIRAIESVAIGDESLEVESP